MSDIVESLRVDIEMALVDRLRRGSPADAVRHLRGLMQPFVAARDDAERDRDRWRRYAGMLRERLAAAQDAARKWHHDNGRVGEELRSLAAKRDNLAVALAHADGDIIDLTNDNDALRQQLAEAKAARERAEADAGVLAAVRCLLGARSWDVMGQEFLALKAAFAAMEKGDAT